MLYSSCSTECNYEPGMRRCSEQVHRSALPKKDNHQRSSGHPEARRLRLPGPTPGAGMIQPSVKQSKRRNNVVTIVIQYRATESQSTNFDSSGGTSAGREQASTG